MSRFALILSLLCWCGIVEAHKPSDSYLSLRVEGDSVLGQWDIALRDLEDAIGLDGNDDGAITWSELRSRRGALEAYALSRLQLVAGDEGCPLQADDLLVEEHSDGRYAVLRMHARCSQAPTHLSVRYQLLFDLDAQHRGLLKFERDGHTETAVLSPTAATFESEEEAPRAPWREFLDYAREGVWHIWIGYDHILFLLSLLLPAALVLDSGVWRARAGFAPAFWDVFKIVTAFTVAHSITLSLAVSGVVALPSRWVESAIAASVAAAALNNLFPLFIQRRAVLAFAFGLIHGLGFAAVLLDLGLPDQTRLLALVAFNLGVEAGQLAIVGLVLPLIYALSRSLLYSPLVLKFGSACITVVALLWLTERGLDLPLGRF